MSETIPRSPKDTLDELPYFPRLCDKIRLFVAGELHPDYHNNLGKGFDLWTCQLLQVEYANLVQFVTENNADDRAALDWCYANGIKPDSTIQKWWCSYMRNRGVNDDLSVKLAERIAEANLNSVQNIHSFFDFIDAEEGR